MRFDINGRQNPDDPFNKKRDPLDPKNENKTTLSPDSDQEIHLDPFGGKKPKPKKERKHNGEKKARKEQVEESVEKINEKLNLEKDNPIEKIEKPIQTILAKKDNLKKEGKKINPKIKTALFIAIPILAICLIATIFKDNIINTIITIQDDKTINSTQVMMPDVTGLDEDIAIQKLHDKGINTTIEYMYNKFFDNGTVIKCSIDPDNPVEKGSVIKVYVCKDTSVSEIVEGSNCFKNVILPETPTKKSLITLTNIQIDDIYLITKFRNDSSRTISSIKYTLGLIDEDGEKILNRDYVISNINLEPFDTVTDKIKLENPRIKEITLEYIEFKYLEG